MRTEEGPESLPGDVEPTPKKKKKQYKKFTHPDAEALAKHLIRFFNIAFRRNIRGSREFVDAVSDALNDKYPADEIRLAFWVARCSSGKATWLSERLRTDMLPHIVLRHHGRVNNQTGKEAMRWLDDLLARANEASKSMLQALFESLPDDMKPGEKELLDRLGLRWE